MPSFWKTCLIWVSTVRSAMNRRAAIARLDKPSATSDRTSRSRAVSSVERIVGAGAADEPRDDRRVDDGLAVVDAAQRVDEDRDVEDALLQEVSDLLGMLLEEPQRVARLHVLRQDEHGDAGWSARMRSAATRPSSVCVGGILMSTIAASGFGYATCRISARRHRPAPTTSRPASSRTRTMPSRVSIVSSATTTRTGSPRSSVQAQCSAFRPERPPGQPYEYVRAIQPPVLRSRAVRHDVARPAAGDLTGAGRPLRLRYWRRGTPFARRRREICGPGPQRTRRERRPCRSQPRECGVQAGLVEDRREDAVGQLAQLAKCVLCLVGKGNDHGG